MASESVGRSINPLTALTNRKPYIAFLKETLGAAAKTCGDRAIAFVCIDWRHRSELLTVGKQMFVELKNLRVWIKTTVGMGSFYRSKRELVFVFKVGDAPHLTNLGLGESGRRRNSVWNYAGISSLGLDLEKKLASHPTVKPIALVTDAIQDCSKRSAVVLDCFGGSGATLIAAEKTGRRARLLEYDPIYCDTIARRLERFTGKRATLLATGESFEELEEQSLGEFLEEKDVA